MNVLQSVTASRLGDVTASALSLAVSLSIPFLSTVIKTRVAGASDLQTRGSLSGRRGRLLRRRRFKPKKNVFSGTWSALYLVMGFAAWLVWRQGGWRAQAVPLCLYLLQLAVNLWAWPPIFVGGQRRRYAFADSAALLGVSLVTMGKFYAASPAAGFLMLPYLGWTCFATTLINCSLWDSNPAVVQSAHKVAQVRPQEPHEVPQSRSLHKRNITCPADLGKINPTTAAQMPGSIQYSDRPILGRRTSGEHLPTQDWHRPLVQNNQQPQLHSAQPQLHSGQPQLQQPWDSRADNQPAMNTPFAEAGLHRRSATDSSRRSTRRTTDDHISSDRLVTHTDSGHLIIPQWSWDRPERKNSPGLGGSGIFARMSLNLQAAAEALTDSAPGLPSPFERISKSVNQFVGGPSEDLEGLQTQTVPEEEELDMSIRSDSIDTSFFADPGSNGIKLRGPTYLEDKKKVEAGEPICWLSSVNLMEVTPTFHIARFLPSILDSKAPFTFALQIMVPGKTNVSLTLSWSTDYDPIAAAQQPGAAKQGPKGDSDSEAFAAFDRCIARFMEGDNEDDVKRRHNTFKLIPKVTKGSWVIRNAVGSTPVLLGKKLTTKYFRAGSHSRGYMCVLAVCVTHMYPLECEPALEMTWSTLNELYHQRKPPKTAHCLDRGPNYFEVDIDVGSSKSAASVVGLVQGALKGLVIDMAITMEGHTKDELPEALLGAVRLQNLDLSSAAVLDLETGHITRKS